MNIIDLLNEPFMQRALAGALIVAILSAVVGVFITLRKESIIVEGVAHASLAGVAVGFVLGWMPVFPAILTAIIMVSLITYLKRSTKVSSDALIGIVFSVLFALGLIILYSSPGFKPDLESYLFGTVLGIGWNDVAYAFMVLSIVLISVTLFYDKLVYMTFDSEAASIRGVNVKFLEYFLNLLVAVSIIVSVKVVGIILVTALFIIPASSAKLIAKKFQHMIPISILHNVLATIIGIILATKLPPGPVIVVTSGVLFFLVAAFNELKTRVR